MCQAYMEKTTLYLELVFKPHFFKNFFLIFLLFLKNILYLKARYSLSSYKNIKELKFTNIMILSTLLCAHSKSIHIIFDFWTTSRKRKKSIRRITFFYVFLSYKTILQPNITKTG